MLAVHYLCQINKMWVYLSFLNSKNVIFICRCLFSCIWIRTCGVTCPFSCGNICTNWLKSERINISSLLYWSSAGETVTNPLKVHCKVRLVHHSKWSRQLNADGQKVAGETANLSCDAIQLFLWHSQCLRLRLPGRSPIILLCFSVFGCQINKDILKTKALCQHLQQSFLNIRKSNFVSRLGINMLKLTSFCNSELTDQLELNLLIRL